MDINTIGTYNVAIYRNIKANVSSPTNTIDDRSWRVLINNVQVASSSNGSNFTIPSATTLSQSITLGPITIAAGDAVKVEWTDNIL